MKARYLLTGFSAVGAGTLILGLGLALEEPPQAAALRLEKTLFAPGEEIRVSFQASRGYAANAWVGIIPSTVPHGSEAVNDQYDLTYQYLRKRVAGELFFKAPVRPGAYDLRMHDTDNRGREVASVSFRVGEERPAASGPAPSSGPKMRIMEPAVTDPTQPVEVSQRVLTLRGAVLDAHGVLSVMVGDRQAEMRSTGDIRAVEFAAKDILLHEGLNRVNVVATNVDHQNAQFEVLLWYRASNVPAPATPPPAPSETEARKTASPETATPQPAPAAEPAAPPAGSSEAVPLHKDEILQMVQNMMPSEQIVELVIESGIDFEPTHDYLETLRKAGAKENLIDAVRQAKRVKR